MGHSDTKGDYASHPLNLAAFRVAVFSAHLIVVASAKPFFFSSLPHDFIAPPIGLSWLLEILPINTTVMAVVFSVYLFSCFTGLVGLYSRTSAAVATLLGLYVLGVPNFFGKVSHYHHVIWFSAILATCRCGDALSVDAFRQAVDRARGGRTEPPGASDAYGRPLRYVWALMGFIYFFPGLWKLAYSGSIEWLSAENFRLTLYQKWAEQGMFRPELRVEQWPILPDFVGPFTVLFELSFVLLAAHPVGRRVALIVGTLFHTGTWVLMRINFMALQICYVALVDVHGCLVWLGRALFPAEAILAYDPEDAAARRFVAVVRAFDVFERVSFVEDPATPVPTAADSGGLRIQFSNQGGHWDGLACARPLLGRVPLLAGPFLLGRLPFGGNLFLGSPRTRGDVRVRASEPSPTLTPATVWIANLLLFSMWLTGFARLESAWPVACYPTFGGIATAEKVVVRTYAKRSGGVEETIDITPTIRTFGSARFAGLLDLVIRVEDEARRTRLLGKLWSVAVGIQPELRNISTVRWYSETISVLPDREGEGYLSRKLLAEIQPHRSDSPVPAGRL